jgi:hypothetical protein
MGLRESSQSKTLSYLKDMRRLPIFNWINATTANKKQADGIYDETYQVIGIDERLGNRKLIKTIIHELSYYFSDSYPKEIKKLSEKEVIQITKQIYKLLTK